MIILIKNSEIYDPDKIGKRDILISGHSIVAIQEEIMLDTNVDVKIIDGHNLLALPGFIDCHVHIAGGGGEGGFSTRTPEITLSDLIEGGVTTVVGTLGTDGVGRNMAGLLAKAKALEEEGITAFVNTGSYQVPVKTFTDSISMDIMYLDQILGVGEIAVSDHRSSAPTLSELSKIAAEVRVASMLAGKKGVVNIHIGDGVEVLEKIEEIVETTEIPIEHFLPTHMNRAEHVFEAGLKYLEKGGYIDFTTSSVPAFIEEGEIHCVDGIQRIMKKGLDLNHVTFSSDGQGSLPTFDKNNVLTGMELGRVTSLYETVRQCVFEGHIKLEEVLKLITANPAHIFGMKKKGHLKVDYDGDVVLVDKDTLEIQTLISKGVLLKESGKILKKGNFES